MEAANLSVISYSEHAATFVSMNQEMTQVIWLKKKIKKEKRLLARGGCADLKIICCVYPEGLGREREGEPQWRNQCFEKAINT